MAKLLEDRVAIVTGAGQGLGLAIARAASVDGAQVLVVSRREKQVAATVAAIREAGGKAEGWTCDITEEAAPGAIVNTALSRFGRLDCLVNCAGVFIWKKLLEFTAEEWSRTLAINLTAPFYLTQEAARVMIDGGHGGVIVNIASIHGRLGDPHVAPQCASKFGLLGLTESSAEALREFDIRVNAIAPGSIEPNSADRRGVSPSQKVTQADIATLAVYLMSDLARSITGAVFDMYGNTRRVIKI